jgi:hypothetical protein
MSSDGVDEFDADIEYLHIGGTLPFGGWEHAQPYFAAGLGVTRFSASDTGRPTTHASSSRARWRFGLEVPLAKHAALRFEGRGYLTFTDTDTSFFCKSDNGRRRLPHRRDRLVDLQGECSRGFSSILVTGRGRNHTASSRTCSLVEARAECGIVPLRPPAIEATTAARSPRSSTPRR